MSEQDDKAAKRAQWEEINRAKAAAKRQAQEVAAQTKSAPVSPRKQFQAIRGTRDLLPPDTALWNHVEQTAHTVFSTFGFGEIRTPIFESNELFARSVGTATDIVSKEMYFLEKPLAETRAYIEGIETPGVSLQAPAYIVLCFKFCEDALKQLKVGGIPNTTGNAELLNEFERRQDDIRKLLCRDEPTDLRDLGQYLLKIISALELSDSFALRPEATASVCRAYIEHSMQQLPQPVKLYYMGPMFRRERPQKGRYRQFYQIGAEVLGGQDAPAIDAELIEMLMTFFDKLELKGIELDINSIGHNAPNCRPAYIKKLRDALFIVKDELGADSQRRIETNALRVLDSKLDFEQPIIARLPKIADNLCDECKSHYAAVKQQLQLRGILYRENWRLVRGLDYYMRTTFEITAQGLGSQNAVCGGGRYDGLVELLGGPPTKGIGFAIGEDRLILSLQEQARQAEAARPAQASAAASGESKNSPLAIGHSPLSVYIAWMGHNTYATAVRAAKDLRNAGFSVELPPTELKFGKALNHADKLGARFALILGENEVSENLWTLKNLSDGTQQKLPEPDLLDYLRQSR